MAKKTLRERFDSLLSGLKTAGIYSTPEQQAAEEASELVAYNALRVLLDSVGSAYDEASGIIDELIADEEENPTESAAAEESEETVETARLESVMTLAYAMSSSLSSIVSLCAKELAPDLPAPSDPRYMAEFKALIGKAISSKNMAVVQKAHDSSHDMHSSTVALGASCNGMKLLEGSEADEFVDSVLETSELRAACRCEGDDMDRKGHIAALLALSGANFTDDQKKGIEYLPDANLASLHTLAAKSPADSIIQAKAAADAALAGHAHGLNAKDLADATAKKKAEDDAAAADDAKGKQKAAEAKTPEARAAAQAKFYEENPEIKALVDRQKQQDEDKKAVLIAGLKACGGDEAKLKLKTLEQLEELATFAKVEVNDYSGRGLAMHDDKDVYSNPPDPYAEALKARKAAVN